MYLIRYIISGHLELRKKSAACPPRYIIRYIIMLLLMFLSMFVIMFEIMFLPVRPREEHNQVTN